MADSAAVDLFLGKRSRFSGSPTDFVTSKMAAPRAFRALRWVTAALDTLAEEWIEYGSGKYPNYIRNASV
jgi:hypothetical protein